MRIRACRWSVSAAALLVTVSACSTRTSQSWPERPAERAAPGNEFLSVTAGAIEAMRPIEPSATLTGTLSPADPVLDGGEHYRLASFPGRRGERVTVSLSSGDFDTYLRLGRRVAQRTIEIFETDDDGGVGLNSRLRTELPRDGQYVIVTTSFAADETGGYTLELEPFTGPLVDTVEELDLAPDVRQRLRPVTRDQVGRGELTASSARLDNGRHYEAWSVTADEGEELTIALESDDFDTYLYVGLLDDDGRLWAIDRDDDGGGDRNSRLDFDVPSAGDYAILVTSFRSRDTGRYRLAVGRRLGEPLGERIPTEVLADAPTLEPGRLVRGAIRPNDPTLADGHRYDLWRYRPAVDGEVAIDLRSPEFDTYLLVLAAGGDGPVVVARNDDGGEGLNSSLTTRLEAGRSYLVLVRGYGVDDLGDYTLSAEPVSRE